MPARAFPQWGLPAALLVLVLAVYLLTGSSDLKHNGDTDLRFQTTQAIVDHHRIWISNPLWRDSRISLGRGGHLYAFYAPGQSILMIPLYIAGKAIAHHLSLPYDVTTLYACRSLDLFLGGLVAILFYFLAMLIGYSEVTAAVLTLVYAFGSTAWPDAQGALEQTPVTLFILLAAFCTVRFTTQNNRTRSWLLLGGLSLGAAILTRYDASVFTPAFVVCVLWARAESSNVRAVVGDLVAIAAGLLPLLGAIAAWNIARFGSPVLTGLHESTFGGNPLQGALGLAISPGKGIFWYVPVLLLLPWCLRKFRRRAGPVIVLFLALAFLAFALYSNVLYWHGDPAWGPRYLYPVVPYLVLPLGEIIERWRKTPTLVTVLVAVTLVSFGIQIAAVSVTDWRFWYRLQAIQQQTVNEATWSGQPFRWGASHYHYYWNVSQSPILIQVDSVYQVARLTLGDKAYKFLAKPDPYVASNTADSYPINTFAFWWLDPLHPVLGSRTRAVLALTLFTAALGALFVVLGYLRRKTETGRIGLGLEIDLARPRSPAS